MTKRKLPPVDTWSFIYEGIEPELFAGFNRGIKHIDIPITDEQIRHICDCQHQYLMNWFAEAFQFPES